MARLLSSPNRLIHTLGTTVLSSLFVSVIVSCVAKDDFLDADGDGYVGLEDCDPFNAAINKGAIEQPRNGIDDNCDGNIDEPTANNDWDGDGYSVIDGDCNDTNAAIHPGAKEVCDNVDNDCDGKVDAQDNKLDVTGSCLTGLPGECSTGEVKCQDGQILCIKPSIPPNEIKESKCDGLDNDCDGSFDEGCDCIGGQTQRCGLTYGECEKSPGTQTCENGVWGECQNPPQPVAETCNGLDDDCDGTKDNPAPIVCFSNSVCQYYLEACSGGVDAQCPTSDNIPSEHDHRVAEVCNGLDDDCDGIIDNAVLFDGDPCSTGIPGVCANGTWVCSQGTLECQPIDQASTEQCNGIDDDCDGDIDEEGCPCVPGTSEECDIGGSSFNNGSSPNSLSVCAKGIRTCQNTVSGSPLVDWGPCVGASGPSTPKCNGLDNDCDGLVPDSGLTCGCIDGSVDSSCPASVPSGCEPGSFVPGTRVCVQGQYGACQGAYCVSCESLATAGDLILFPLLLTKGGDNDFGGNVTIDVSVDVTTTSNAITVTGHAKMKNASDTIEATTTVSRDVFVANMGLVNPAGSQFSVSGVSDDGDHNALQTIVPTAQYPASGVVSSLICQGDTGNEDICGDFSPPGCSGCYVGLSCARVYKKLE